METNNTFDYKKLRSQISLNFGVELDETATAILHIILLNQASGFQAQNKKLDVAINNIDQSSRKLEVSRDSPKSQAFWFGIGIWGLPICLFIITAGICGVYWEQQLKEEQLLPQQLKWYKDYYNFFKDADPKLTRKYLEAYPPAAEK